MIKRSKVKKQTNEKVVNLRVNEEIKAKTVRVVGSNIGGSAIVSIEEALKMAEDEYLDLVEISPDSNPPVCKIISYSKYKYEQKRHQDKIKANTKEKVVKEIRLTPSIALNDLTAKVNQSIKFLKNGEYVKVSVSIGWRFRGHDEQAKEVMNKFIDELSNFGKPDSEVKIDGKKKIYTVITPSS